MTLERNAKLRRIIAARSRQSRVQQQAQQAQQATSVACVFVCVGITTGCTHSGPTTAGQLTRMVTSRVERVASRLCLSRCEIGRSLAEILAGLSAQTFSKLVLPFLSWHNEENEELRPGGLGLGSRRKKFRKN